MSYFDIGNVITILIVILILAMYRQMDRNNRSLEKVKKFADKMKDQLDEFVDGKTIDLKNLGIELDVHQKTAKEILKRITHIEEDFTQRTSDLEVVARRVDEYEQGLQGIVTMTGRVDENLKRLQKESEFIDTVGRRLKEAVSRMGVLEKQIPELKHDFGKQNSAALKLVSQQVIKDVRGQAERLGKIAVVSEKKMKEYAGTIRDLDVRREEMFKESVTSIQTTFDEKFAEAEKAGEQILARFDSDLDHSIHVSDNNAQKLIDRIEDLHEELGRRINTSEEDLRSKLDTFQDQVNILESQYQENLRNASKRGETLEDEIFTSLKDHVENRAREVEQVLSSELGEIRKNIEESREELNALFGETRSEITVWQATLQKRMENSQIEYDNRYTEFSRNIESNLISLADNTKANTGQQRDDLEKFINETRSGVIDFETSVRHRLDAVDEKLQQKEDAFRELMKVSMKRETETAKTAVEQMNEAITAFEERVKERYQEVENKLGEYEGEVTYRFNRIDEVNLDIDRLEENLRNLMEQISENMKKDFVQFGKELNLLREEEKVSFEKDLTALHQSMDGLENGLVELKSRAYDNVSEKLRIFEDEFFSDIQERNDSMQEKLSAWQIEIDDRIISISESEEKRRVDLEKQYSENLSKRIEDFSLQSTRQQEVVEQHIQEYQDRLHGQVEEMQGSIESLKNNLFNEIEEIQGLSRESFERLFSEHQSTVESTLKKHEREIEAGLQDIDSHFEIGQRELQGLMESSQSDSTLWKAEIRNNIEESREELNALFGETRSEITVWQATLQKRMEDSQIEYDNRYTEFSRNVESSLISLTDNTKANAGQQRDDFEKFINETRSGVIDFETSIRHRLNTLDEKLQQKEDAFSEAMKVSMKRETETAKTVVEQMNESITAFEERLKERYQEVENKLGEYEGEVTYRFNRIDEVNLDIDRLEENLRNLMEQISENMKKDFVQFGKELNLLREEEKVSFEKDLTALHQSMDDLENGLVELKSRAYDNVSEKLRIFEDEFFSDIRERNDSMKEKLSAWQIEIDDRIISISESEEKRRLDLEKQYSENLSKRIEDFSLQSTRQQEIVEQRIQEFQDRLNGQVEEMHGSNESLKNNLFNEIEEIQGLSRESFERLFSEHQSTVESTLKKHEREIEAGLQDIDSHLEIGQRELQGLMESSQSDITLWRAEILKEMNESEANLREGVEVFKTAIQDTVGDLKEEFSTQRMDLIENTREERDRLKEELSEIQTRVGELSADLQEKSTAALENFRTDYESFLEQFQNNARVLTVNIQEIDKKQKNFITQTRIFDRADSLKNTLSENIEDLKGEIARVDSQGREIREAEKQFLKIKKLGDEVSTKLTKFLNERRRIEEMDSNFKKLINISQAVDSKLAAVTASHDGLQEIQAKIRELENLEKEVQQNYQRLEHKQTLIESTTAGVDRNFQHLEDLEGQINEFRGSLKILPSQVTDLSARINTLSSNKENADKVVDLLGDVDKLLSNLTERMEKLQTAREWLARTETRLDELGKQAQEQVQLLGTLLKDGAKAAKAGKGAPAMNVREMVTRLAHQGWSVKEIAQATKLSRGEVELILELLPKK